MTPMIAVGLKTYLYSFSHARLWADSTGTTKMYDNIEEESVFYVMGHIMADTEIGICAGTIHKGIGTSLLLTNMPSDI